MTLDQLRIFVAAAERGHMTQAARALNLAQSAVSHAVAALETRHDAKLFERIGRRIELTEAGRAFLVEARIILAQAAHAEATLGAFGKLERGTLTMHASQTIASYWLPRRLAAFRRAYPGIAVRLEIGNTVQVAEALELGASELGFVEGVVRSPMLTSIAVALDQLVLAVGPDHPWARDETFSPTAEDLLSVEWVLREPGSGTRAAFETALQAWGIDWRALKVAIVLPANQAVRGAVEAGMGATVISASVAALSLEAGLLHRVRFHPLERKFHMLLHKRRGRSRIAAAFMEILGM